MASWYACHTRARSEKKAASLLRRKGFPTYLPMVPTERQWSDRKKVVEWPVFPSYVFCRFEREELIPVVRTPGVADVVRHAGEPAAIRDEEIENVRRFVEALAASGLRPNPAPDFRTGQTVRVVSGPFRGVRGRVREIRGRRRLLVGIDRIGQALEVDVSADAVSPLK